MAGSARQREKNPQIHVAMDEVGPSGEVIIIIIVWARLENKDNTGWGPRNNFSTRGGSTNWFNTPVENDKIQSPLGHHRGWAQEKGTSPRWGHDKKHAVTRFSLKDKTRVFLSGKDGRMGGECGGSLVNFEEGVFGKSVETEPFVATCLGVGHTQENSFVSFLLFLVSEI